MQRFCTALLTLILIAGGAAWTQQSRAQETQLLQFQEESLSAGAIGGYLPGGPVDVGFGGAVLTFRGGYDVGILYSGTSAVSAFGLQFGKSLRSSGEGPIPIGVRFGGNLQSLSFEAGGESSFAGGATFTVGMPFQRGEVFVQPVGTFAVSLLPIDQKEEGGFVHGLRPSASAGVAVGASASGLTFLMEPVVRIPIVDEQTTAYGIAVSVLAALN